MPVRENPQHSPQWNVSLGGETSSSLLDPFLAKSSVKTGQRRVDPLAAIFIRQNQSGNGQRAEQEYQRQSRDVNNTRQGSRSQEQVQSSKVGQSGVKHRDSRMNNAQKCQPGQEQDFAVSACESAA